MNPGEVYILAVVATALMVAPFNALARVIVLSWMVAHGCWMLGLPEAWANLFGQSCVLLLGFRRARCLPCLTAWAMSVPMLMVNVAWILGIATPFSGWWLSLIIALVQLAVLPLALDSTAIKAVTRAWHQSRGEALFRAEGA